MSTNNLNTNNNASQTLFRFTSLRNPQLTETKRRNLGFIHRPKGIAGVFDTAVSGRIASTAKINAMESAIKSGTFASTAFKTEKELETGVFGQLLIIGRKISKKEKVEDQDLAYTKSYYAGQIDSNKELNGEGLKVFDLLWNNLIYQVVSQKDFYVKEAISHILKAIHLGFAQNMTIDADVLKANREKPLENALNGKIVLPKELFVEDETTSGSGTPVLSKTASASTKGKVTDQRLINEAESSLVVQKALHKKEGLNKLNSELQKLQKSYHKSSYKAQQDAYAKYMEEYKSQLDESRNVSEEIDRLAELKTPEEELRKLYDRLKELAVPPFEFSYKDEINLEDLKSKLSPESFDLFVELFSDVDSEKVSSQRLAGKSEMISGREMRIGEQAIQLDDSLQTYYDAINMVQSETSSQMQTALENSTLPEQQYVNLGGASIPVVQNTTRTPLAYSLIANNYGLVFLSNRGFLSFSFEVEDISWDVANAKIIADTDSGHYEENYSNISVVDTKITLPVSLVNKFSGIYNFRIEVTFKNGREAYTDVQKIANGQVQTGMLTLKPANDNLCDDPTDPSKRKNFGIKRLGIADYLKVVQSVHAYVPGLVSNIENVMASELRHKSSVARDYSEITDTTSKSVETEKVSDTSKTSRTDMQTEVAKELDKQQSITAYAHFSYNPGYKLDIGADYANNTAQHDSTRQAVAKSQEITERAMERVLTKINEERVQKIIKEYTETNVHEFDNRGKALTTNEAPHHITGVYRWIDMKYKNQIYNYGKRTMFEFMVPEPAKLHRLALAVSKGQILTAPVDPRKATAPWTMINPKSATVEQIQHWAQIYGVDLEAFLANTKQIVHSATSVPQTNNDFGVDYSQIAIPGNYAAKNASFSCRSSRNRGGGWSGARYSEVVCSNLKGDMIGRSEYGDINFDESVSGLNLSGNLEFKVKGHNVNNYNIKVTVNCELNDEYIDKWKTDGFNAIIKAYETAYKTFQDEQAKLDEEQKAKEAESKEKMGQFYRYMEHDVLKHNCIAYLLQDYLNVLGQNFTNGDTMPTFEVVLGNELDKYTALSKFMEQAFEWEIMDYTFYPYYWANRKMWQEMYVSDSVDPLFRSFLQAGMARVIVTVKPGFEDAVQFFMTTGKIWNGGEVPVIGDPMYMSIVDEMRKPTGEAQGKYWITRMPTTLTILQDKSTGLPVNQPLPIFPETDPTNCENPTELEVETSFRLDVDAQLSHSDKPTTLPSTIIKPI